jgi:hypothetical protein
MAGPGVERSTVTELATVTVAMAVTAVPLAGVTVSVYVVVVVGLTVTPVPLVTSRFPGVTTPVPFAKTPVRVAVFPAVMVVGLATKLVMVAGGPAGFTVMMAVAVIAAPVDGVTVRVYVVVALGLTLTAVPLVAAILPGVITPVPLAKIPVSVALWPAVMVAGLATKLVIVGSGFTVIVTLAVTAAPLNGVTVRV